MRKMARYILDFLEVYLPTFIFFLLIMSVALEVFFRYVFDYPIPELFELSIYTFIWTIYLGAALAKRYDQHIRFDIFYAKFPKKVRLIVDIFFDTLTSIVLFILFVPSIKYTIINYNIKASALRIPWTYLLLCFPIFVCLILVHNGLAIVANLNQIRGGETRPEERPPWQ
jgi:TRAP-type C4-dicarboxylate transport system permease small subunit